MSQSQLCPLRHTLIACAVLATSAFTTRSKAESKDIAGVYVLQSISGQRLPYVQQEDGSTRVELAAAVLTINANGNWSQRFSGRVTSGGSTRVDTRTERGRYSIHSDSIRLSQDKVMESVDAELQGGDLTFIANGVTLRYAKVLAK